ncbi:MAG: dTMP kinase [Dehalococcoidia bacterium]|nr:dTMP kinase [Dehalococcoidia bacterium]
MINKEGASLGNQNGLFIVLEGIDGSGKSTQARRLKATLDRLGRKSLLLHEPGGTPLGEKINSLVKHSTHIDIGHVAETLLFAAARAQLIEEVIQPALLNGTTIVCDRFTPSTEAYQGYGRSVPEELVKVATRYVVGALVPDIVIWLDVEVETGLARKQGPHLFGVADRFEDEESSFHNRVRNGYIRMGKERHDLWFRVDGAKPVDEVEANVWRIVQERLSKVN